MEYIEYQLFPIPFEPWNEILVLELSQIGFESFMEDGNQVKAYISAKSEDIELVNVLLAGFSEKIELSLEWNRNCIAHQNWNEVWESNFEPVYVGDSLSIVAPFHPAAMRRNHVIEIEPKMSFGTGHHQTTFLMCQQLLNLDLKGMRVLDMGTGTGVLAILAEQMGARECVAIDIESWSVENTIWNAKQNACTKILAIEGDVSAIPNLPYDCIVANINKNVLKDQLPVYTLLLNEGGVILLSGFFISDVTELTEIAFPLSLQTMGVFEKESWALIKLQKIIPC